MGRRKQTMCRCLAVVIAALLFLPLTAAKAETTASFLKPLYFAAYGETVTIEARVSADKATVWILKGEDGAELGRTRVAAKKGVVSFDVAASKALPYRTVLRLFPENGTEALCEAQLFCDQKRNNGLRQTATDQKKLAFTFDAANSAANTLEILDILEQYGAKGTFFVIGQYALANPAVCEEIVSRGHELASHSYEHLEMVGATPEKAYESVQKADALLRTFNGDSRVLYRPPSGRSTFRDRAIARGLGSEVILWSIDSGDGFSYVSESGVQSRIRQKLHNGGIVLMHVYGRYTRQALKVLLPYYASQGYALVTVSELLLSGPSYIDEYGTQRPLQHAEERVAPIAAWLRDGR